MTQRPKWLPPELKYSDYSGNWDKFLYDVYEIFTHDFIQSDIQYEGLRFAYDSRIENGKEMAYQCGRTREKSQIEDVNRGYYYGLKNLIIWLSWVGGPIE
ncbi:hypothetical protein ACFLYR_06390 [Chloroflexota bacterium]